MSALTRPAAEDWSGQAATLFETHRRLDSSRVDHVFVALLPRLPRELNDLRVIVVDDTPTNLEILGEQLRSWGFQATPAADAGSALAGMRQAAAVGRPFQLAIIDQVLPDMDGLALAQAIKTDQALPDVPLLMLSSYHWLPAAGELCAAGLAAVLAKPTRQSQLFNTIARIFAGGVSQSQQWATATPAASRPMAGMRVLIADDNEINRMVAGEMLAAGGYHCEMATNGTEALEAVQAHPYDLVLMDCQMPQMDGYEATRYIRLIEIGTEKPNPTTIMMPLQNSSAGPSRQMARPKLFVKGDG